MPVPFSRERGYTFVGVCLEKIFPRNLNPGRGGGGGVSCIRMNDKVPRVGNI